MNNWKRWFAWYPVKTLGGRWVWFRDVERREYVSCITLETCLTIRHYRMPKVSFWAYSPDALKYRLLITRFPYHYSRLLNETRFL